MSAYRKKPVVIEATQWLKRGDHPHVLPAGLEQHGCPPCQQCNRVPFEHGWIETLEGRHIVCPGDWIITGVEGEHYPCKPSVFATTYERVES